MRLANRGEGPTHGVTIYLRVALAAGFLAAVTDRLGLWGPSGTTNVAWGDMQHFFEYAAKLNPWFPKTVIPTVGWFVTIAETTLGVALLLGFRTRMAALLSGWLLFAFATGMTVGTGFKSALNASVFAASAGAFLLAHAPTYPVSLDSFSAKRSANRKEISSARISAPSSSALGSMRQHLKKQSRIIDGGTPHLHKFKFKNWRELMRKIIAITQLTLDGVMQGPGGPEEDASDGFAHGGWAMPFGDDVVGQTLRETVAGEFDMLLGRRTYEIFAAYWPDQGGPITKAFNKATKYVVTRSLDQLEWENSRQIGGDVVDEVRRLKASDGPELHIWGSSELLQTLIAADLVDEYRVWISPVVVGGGKRLFENGVPPRSLSLVATRTSPRGVLLNIYRPAGPLPKV